MVNIRPDGSLAGNRRSHSALNSIAESRVRHRHGCVLWIEGAYRAAPAAAARIAPSSAGAVVEASRSCWFIPESSPVV